MRRLSIAFACAAVVFASQACLADSHAPSCLVRAQTSVEQFQQDRDDCITKAMTGVWGSCNSPKGYYPDTPGGPPQVHGGPCSTLDYKPNAPKFLHCMQGKGYQESPTGCPAGQPLP
jgi:hypothetical protein